MAIQEVRKIKLEEVEKSIYNITKSFIKILEALEYINNAPSPLPIKIALRTEKNWAEEILMEAFDHLVEARDLLGQIVGLLYTEKLILENQ